ncbi:fumarylacetoacetate hydrolase family protein [Burkholderia anthina]|uniref:fumarylacetoacetate hydrolase family protein n=1 Tax=Burkholderia anthina TaxID=179879 RepID=UPI00158D2F8F
MLRFGTAMHGGESIAVARAGEEQRYIDVTALCRDIATLQSLDDLLDLPDDLLGKVVARARGATGSINATQLRLLAPLVRPVRFRDCGIIVSHLVPSFKEMARRVEISYPDKAPEVKARLAAMLEIPFHETVVGGDRDVESLTGEGSEVVCLNGELDFELELAAVVRRRPDGSHDLFGYTFYNDWSIRDLQVKQFTETGDLHGEAKNFPGSNVIGPMVVLATDVVDPAALEIRAEIDGKPYAAGSLAGAAWAFPDAVDHLFAGQTLEGHELVGSGTVLGGSCFENGDRLRDGAVVQFRSPEIGNLTMLSRQS